MRPTLHPVDRRDGVRFPIRDRGEVAELRHFTGARAPQVDARTQPYTELVLQIL